MADELKADEILFWLKSGMGLQEDKRFLLTIIADQKKLIDENERWRDHANKEYDKLRIKYNNLKARVTASVNELEEYPGAAKSTAALEAEAIGAATVTGEVL